MLMGFDTDRALARLAADAAHIEDVSGGSDRPWSRAGASRANQARRARPQPADRRARDRCDAIADLIEIAVVGDPDRLCTVLTHDARGWSPGLTFSSRDEAVAALRERESVFEVVDFRLNRLLWSDTNAVAEWEVEVDVAAPLLVGDDVLVDAPDHHVMLSGASIVDLRGERISTIHTYFDDAALIEQVVLGH
jgi:hypothetical protein